MVPAKHAWQGPPGTENCPREQLTHVDELNGEVVPPSHRVHEAEFDELAAT